MRAHLSSPWLALLVLGAAAGCEPGATSGPQCIGAEAAFSSLSAAPPTESALLTVAAQPGVRSFRDGLAVVCPIEAGREESHAGCDIHVVAPDGSMQRVCGDGALDAARLGDGRVAMLDTEHRLRIDGNAVANGVLEMRVASDGLFLIVTETPDGLEPDLGSPTQVSVIEVSTGRAVVLTNDGAAHAGFDVAGTDEIVFASTRSGVAAMYRTAGGDGAQLTNHDGSRVQQGFVPTPNGAVVWLADGRVVYETQRDGAELWVFDPDTGDAKRLGLGRLPQLLEDGSILAVFDEPEGELRAVRFLSVETAP